MSTTTTLVLGPDAGGRSGPAAARGRPALLVDPAWDPDELNAIGADVGSLGAEVTAGLATHAHHDHLLWHPAYGPGVVRWASSGTAAVVARRRRDLLRELDDDAVAPYPDAVRALFGRVTALPGGDRPHRTRIPDPHGRLPRHEVVIHDAHAPGHSALWLPGVKVLVAGDMLSDLEIPLPFDPDDVDAYLAGLDRLEPYVRAATVLVPGHGTPSDTPLRRLDADRRYLDAVLRGRTRDDPRLANLGMAEEHARVLRIVAARTRS
ncbi:MBL fold metallo-hydrolase [Myceligenerans sp. I2]|uniref:MBL fold metallo-hydrolase n=2 Tax=Myceligenerans indicum TaxID=2593663 RepID=A0ABS1LPL7_9MICO|nr:MBL fold metallo-hydrolase [Myceligenerans indicum]